MIDFENLDLITSVDLRNVENKGKSVYHLIYSSQLYGTIFDVYGKFEGDPITITDGEFEGKEITKTKGKIDAYRIERILMKLINYKGILNMGFSGKFQFDPNDTAKTFYFEVQGASTNIEEEFILEKETPLIIPKGEPVRLVFQRILIPLPGFQEILTGVGNSADSNQFGKLSDPPPVFPLFDSEYFERDGIDFYVNDKPGLGTRENAYFHSPGGRCQAASVSLIYP
jgi:hypothetical protein